MGVSETNSFFFIIKRNYTPEKKKKKNEMPTPFKNRQAKKKFRTNNTMQ